MTSHEDIARALKLRLAELTGRVLGIENELRQELPADSEEQAIALENQDALEALEKAELREAHQIQEALKRISEGRYGVCVQCGEEIDPKRLAALPTAASCIVCAK